MASETPSALILLNTRHALIPLLSGMARKQSNLQVCGYRAPIKMICFILLDWRVFDKGSQVSGRDTPPFRVGSPHLATEPNNCFQIVTSHTALDLN